MTSVITDCAGDAALHGGDPSRTILSELVADIRAVHRVVEAPGGVLLCEHCCLNAIRHCRFPCREKHVHYPGSSPCPTLELVRAAICALDALPAAGYAVVQLPDSDGCGEYDDPGEPYGWWKSFPPHQCVDATSNGEVIDWAAAAHSPAQARAYAAALLAAADAAEKANRDV